MLTQSIIDPKTVGISDAFLVALIAIAIVFATLIIVIVTTTLIQKGTDAVTRRMSIMPREENKILAQDEDAVVAVLVASMDFYRETGKEARVTSITRVEE